MELIKVTRSKKGVCVCQMMRGREVLNSLKSLSRDFFFNILISLIFKNINF